LKIRHEMIQLFSLDRHSFLTNERHSYFYLINYEQLPYCEICNNVVKIKHIVLEYPKYVIEGSSEQEALRDENDKHHYFIL